MANTLLKKPVKIALVQLASGMCLLQRVRDWDRDMMH
jgi:hypothetical protein